MQNDDPKLDFTDLKNLQLRLEDFDKVPASELESQYALGFHFYKHKQYQEASHFFRLLVQFCPSEKKYWIGLGATLQALKMYREALDCYATAQILNGNEPDAYLYIHAADCYIALNELDACMKALEAANQRAKQMGNQQIVKHVALMKELWKTNK